MLAINKPMRSGMDQLRSLAGEPIRIEHEYSGFPFWHVLMVEPNREQKSAEWLERVQVFVYLPLFVKQRRFRGRAHLATLHAVIPGLLFVPTEIMDIDRREEVFKYAHVRGFIPSGRGPALLKKAEIEIIREIEAKLNLPPEAKGVLFKRGQQVKFVNDVYAEFWGTGTIIEIASEHRIGVEVKKLFGRVTKVYVPASEIEAM